MKIQKKICEKVALFASFALLALPFFSCATKPAVEIAKEFPIAIVSISSNTTVPWYEEDAKKDEGDINEDGLINSMLNKSINAKNPEISSNMDRINYAEEKLLSMLLTKGNFQLLDKETVLNSSIYKGVKGGMLDFMSASCIPEGYKKLSPDSRKIAKMMMDKLGAKSLMYVTFQFEKEKSHSQVYARTTMAVRILNNKGKMVVRKDYVALSAEGVQMYGNSFDKQSLVDLFPNSIENAINRFLFSLSLEGTEEFKIENAESTPIKLVRPSTQGEKNSEEAAVEDESEASAEKINMARRMLSRGMSAEEVADITELPLEKVKELESEKATE